MHTLFYDMISFSGFLLGMLIIFILVFKNRRVNIQKNFLVILATLLTIGAFSVYISRQGLSFPILFYYLNIIVFVLPVIFFIYSRSVLFSDYDFKSLEGKYLIPLIFILISFPVLRTDTNVYSREFLEGTVGSVSRGNLFIGLNHILQILLLGYYGYVLGQMLFKYIRSAGNKSNRLVWNKFNWLITVNLSCILIIFPGLLVNITGPESKLIAIAHITLPLAVLIFVVYLFFQPEWLYGLDNINNFSGRKNNRKIYNGKHIQEYHTLSEKLNKYLKEAKPFLKRGYSLQALSDDLDISYHELSYFLNQHLKTTFNDYINKFRAEYVSEVIMCNQGSQRYTLEAIAKDAGFGNRTTFINAFKKFIGKTPSHYLRSIQSEKP